MTRLVLCFEEVWFRVLSLKAAAECQFHVPVEVLCLHTPSEILEALVLSGADDTLDPQGHPDFLEEFSTHMKSIHASRLNTQVVILASSSLSSQELRDVHHAFETWKALPKTQRTKLKNVLLKRKGFSLSKKEKVSHKNEPSKELGSCSEAA